MDLKEVQISEIKNLKMIHVFAIDNVSKEESNQYIVAKVAFDSNKTLILNYKDKHFQKFIKRLIERYHLEKNERTIVLLGDLTKKLMNDSSFAILEADLDKGTQTKGLQTLNTNTAEVSKVDNYLKEALKTIILMHKNYEVLSVDEINGFGNKYMATYSIGVVKKQLPLIIAKREDGIIDFKISRIEDINVPTNGTVVVDSGRIDVIWESEDESIKGIITYDANNNVVERKVTNNGHSILYDENRETLLEEDVEKILFYTELCDIKTDEKMNILKTGDNSYLLGIESATEDETKGLVETGLSENLQLQEGKILYERNGIQIDLKEKEAKIKFSNKKSLSKYNNSLNSVLEEETEEITLRKIEVDYKPCILMEKKYKTSLSKEGFSYEVLELSEDVDLRQPFTITRRYPIDKEIKTLENVKQYVREHKGGNK